MIMNKRRRTQTKKLVDLLQYIHFINDPYFIMDMKFWKFALHNIRSLYFAPRRKSNKKVVYFWITPWGNSPTPWYTLVLAILVKRFSTYDVKILLNDMWGSSFGTYNAKIIKLIEAKVPFIRACCRMNLLKLSELKALKLADKEMEMLKEAAKQNTIKKLQTSAGSTRYDQLYRLWFSSLYPMAEKIKGLLDSITDEELVIPGGGYEETGLLCQMCMERHISFQTFDSGLKSMILGMDCIATWQGNTREVYKFVDKMKNKNKVISVGFDILEKRMDAKTDIAASYIDEIVQTCKRNRSNQKRYDIVIFPNIEHDTASLGTHLFFSDYVEWLTKSVRYILDETNASIAVREHPMQRKLGYKHTFDYLIHLYGQSERFRFYSCDENINSYDLIADAHLVIVSTSTIGMEAAMLGKKVITISNVFYGDSKFCIRCDNEEAYFKEISQSIKNPVKLSVDNIEEAAIYYVLTQMCNWAVMDFVPYNQAYTKWTRMKVKDILNCGDTKLFFKALIGRQPLALLIFKKRFKDIL